MSDVVQSSFDDGVALLTGVSSFVERRPPRFAPLARQADGGAIRAPAS